MTKDEEELCEASCELLARQADELIEVYRDAIKGCDPTKVTSYMGKKLSLMHTRQLLLQHIELHKQGLFCDESAEHKAPTSPSN